MYRAWLIYLLAAAGSAGILRLAGDKQVFVRGAQLAELGPPRGGSVSDVLRDKEWIKQANFFADAYLAPESPEWKDTPAARAAPQDIVRMQQPGGSDRWVLLVLDGPAEVAGGEYKLSVSSQPLSYQLPAPVANTAVGPYVRDARNVSFELITKGGWFGLGQSPVTQARAVPVADLAGERPTRLELGVLEQSRATLGRDRVAVDVRLVPFKPQERAGFVKQKAASAAADIGSATVKGSLAFRDPDVAREIMLTPAGRYTSAIVIADRDLRAHAGCARSDTGARIGAYADGLPMLAVSANGWASLKFHLEVYDYGQTLNYRIVALSGDEVTNKGLLLWFIVHDLTGGGMEERVLSRAEVDRYALWLMDVFGVRFTEKDAEGTGDARVKALLQHLASLKG